MSAPIELSLARSEGARSDASQANERNSSDLYAAWEQIFLAARPTEFEPDRSVLPDTKRRDESAAEAQSKDSGHGLHWSEEHSIADPAESHLSDAKIAAPVSISIAARVSTNESVAVLTTGNAINPTSFARLCPTTQAELERPDEILTRAQPPAEPEKPSAETVTVHYDGKSVALGVRNPILSEWDALQSARAVALELQGSALALRRLTLNGRVVYQSAEEAPATHGGAWLFAC